MLQKLSNISKDILFSSIDIHKGGAGLPPPLIKFDWKNSSIESIIFNTGVLHLKHGG